jgi:hypothetical protein
MGVRDNKARFIIGIDPDLHKSGFAVYDRKDKKLTECTSLYMWQVFECLQDCCQELPKEQFFVRLEYPKNTNNYHGGGRGSSVNLGKNQAVAIILKEFLIAKGIRHELIFPAGYSNTFKDEKFFKKTTGYDERTNCDARAAAAMCFKY